MQKDKAMRFSDIPQFTRDGHYRVDVNWKYIDDFLDKGRGLYKVDLDPDFQRAHVWNDEQRKRYVEFCLRGGVGSSEIRFNCPGWMKDYRGPFELVDGKQRLTAVKKFMNNELPVFDGHFYSDFEDSLPLDASFSFRVNDLDTRAEVLQWYLDINAGGVVHTTDELEKVRLMLQKECEGVNG